RQTRAGRPSTWPLVQAEHNSTRHAAADSTPRRLPSTRCTRARTMTPSPSSCWTSATICARSPTWARPRATRGGEVTDLRLDHHDAVAGGDEEREQLPESTRGARESSLTANIPTT